MDNQQPLKPQLTAEDLHQLFDADFETGILRWKTRNISMFSTKRSATIWNARFAGKQALNSAHTDKYKTGMALGKAYLAHRVLYAMKYGEWPDYIDHINGDRSDNRIVNLRSVTRSENGCNSATPKTNTSGHIGVSWNCRDKRWTAYITLNKKRKALGNFVSKEDAIQCRLHHQRQLGFHENHGRQA